MSHDAEHGQRRYYLDLTQPSLYRQPDDENVKLWRYMDFPKFVALLHNRALFLARAIDFSDPWEGAVSPATVAARERRQSPQVAPLTRSEEAAVARASTAVSCWHMNDCESEAMWALYGKAIAIQTRYSLLRDAFPRYEGRRWERDHERPSDFGGRLLLGMVRYEDYEAPIPDIEYVSPLFYKRRSFAHEQEIRLVMPRFLDGLTAARGVDLAQTSPADIPIKGTLVRVELESLIESIVVDPRQPDWFLTCVRAVVSKFEPALADRVHQSAMSAPPVF